MFAARLFPSVILIGAAVIGGSSTPLAWADDPQPDADAKASATFAPTSSEPDLPGISGVELEEVVLSAMKREVTVQEAPAITSVLTYDQMRAMGYRTVADAVSSVPGFLYSSYANTYPYPNPRGVHQGGLVLRDGLDITNRSTGWTTLGMTTPIEMIKRVELISGPGGVLWGSNSFVGVMNLSSRTADDVQHVEAYAGYGDGPGYPSAFKTYLIGAGKFWKDWAKILLYVGYTTYRSPEISMPYKPFLVPAPPSPQGPFTVTGPISTEAGSRSHMLVHEGNLQLGEHLTAHWAVPWTRFRHNSDQMGTVFPADLAEDQIDCTNPANKEACAARVDPTRRARFIQWLLRTEHGQLRYRRRFWHDRIQAQVSGFFLHTTHGFDRYLIAEATDLAKGGVAASYVGNLYRAGGTFDTDIVLPRSSRILFGGEFYYDWNADIGADFGDTDPTVFAIAPVRCPKDAAGNILRTEDGNVCPVINVPATNRFTGGLFLVGQSRVVSTLMLDAGLRVQYYGGKRSLDPTLLFSGGGVWSFMPNWNLKVNYAEGFRPPNLYLTDVNGDINWGGNPFLSVEKSRTVTGEINARLFADYKALRRLSVRVDYSYSWLTDFIEVYNGVYRNSAQVGIHSVEFLADLLLKGGHLFSLGYTFLDISHSERGKLRSVPNQWFVAKGLIDIWKDRLFFSTNLTLTGSMEDYNKVLNPQQPSGEIGIGGTPTREQAYRIEPTDLVVDRVGPAAIWNAKIYYVWKRAGMRFDADVYNILNVKTYQPDTLMDQSARWELMPLPRPGISFLLSAQLDL